MTLRLSVDRGVPNPWHEVKGELLTHLFDDAFERNERHARIALLAESKRRLDSGQEFVRQIAQVLIVIKLLWARRLKRVDEGAQTLEQMDEARSVRGVDRERREHKVDVVNELVFREEESANLSAAEATIVKRDLLLNKARVHQVTPKRQIQRAMLAEIA